MGYGRCVNLSLVLCINTRKNDLVFKKRINTFFTEMEEFIHTEDEEEEEISDLQDKD